MTATRKHTSPARHRWLIAICSAACAIVLGGCNNMYRWDVTQNRAYHVGYVPDQVYCLVTDQALVDPHSEAWLESISYKPRRSAPHFLAPIDRDWPGTVAIVPAGTRLRIDRLEREDYWMIKFLHRSVIAYATILDSPHEGRQVGLSRVSEWRKLYGDKEIHVPLVRYPPIDFPTASSRFLQLADAAATDD